MHQGRGHGARAVSRREGAVDERGRQGSRQAAERRLGDERGCVHRSAPALPLQRIAWRDESEREAVMAKIATEQQRGRMIEFILTQPLPLEIGVKAWKPTR